MTQMVGLFSSGGGFLVCSFEKVKTEKHERERQRLAVTKTERHKRRAGDDAERRQRGRETEAGLSDISFT